MSLCVKLITDEVGYSDETPEYILSFMNGHPLFETEVYITKPGKLSTELFDRKIQIYRPNKLTELKKNSVDTPEI